MFHTLAVCRHFYNRCLEDRKLGHQLEGRSVSKSDQEKMAIRYRKTFPQADGKETCRGTLEKTVVDWTATALYQTCQVDDDGKEAHTTALELRRGEFVKKLDVPGDVFVDDVALRRFIRANAGSQYVVRAGMSKHLVPAIVQLSGEFPTHRHYNFMGWMQLDGRWVYVSPQDCITAKGRLSEPPSVELDQRLRDYGLQATGWQESLQAFDAVTRVLPRKLASCIRAAARASALLSSNRAASGGASGRHIRQWQVRDRVTPEQFLWAVQPRHTTGSVGRYHQYRRDVGPSAGRPPVLGGRLTREAKVRHEKPCRGLILSTGETTIEGEMSVVARMLVLEIPPWEKRDLGGQALVQAERLREHLPGFTAHFASWIAKQLGQGDLKSDIANRFSGNMRGYREKPANDTGGQSNTGRVIQNWTVLVTVYQMLSRFLSEMDEDYLLPAWKDAIVESVRTLRQERASEVFLDILGSSSLLDRQ